jgi:hypothetical protein
MAAFRIAIVLATVGIPALLAPLLVRSRRRRPGTTWKVLAAIVCLIPLSAPMAVAGMGRPGFTMIVAILGGIAMLKAIDWLANPRHRDERLKVFLALTFWPALQIEDVGVRIGGMERRGSAVRRLGAGAVGIVVGLLLTALGQSLDLPARGIWLDSSLKALEIYALAGGANALMVGAFALAGYRVSDGFRYPILARSVLDFWSRYNVWIHRWLKRHVFAPIGRRRRRPALGILAAFALSGLLHEYLIVVAVPGLIGRQFAFFGLHGLGALGGAWLDWNYRIATGHRPPNGLAIAATLAFVLATAPLFIQCMDRFIDLHRDVGARVLERLTLG